jgi:hypothetical protein
VTLVPAPTYTGKSWLVKQLLLHQQLYFSKPLTRVIVVLCNPKAAVFELGEEEEEFKEANSEIEERPSSSILETFTNSVSVKGITVYHSVSEDNDELIMALPNKTPNGIINPKHETVDEFVKIQKVINTIFNNLGMYQHVDKLAIPNLRYKSVSEPETAKDRPYYTSKIHSDAWVGHKGDSIFLIGVLGDIDNNTVEFNEPIGAHDNYLHKADNFDEGNTRYESLKYLGVLTKQKLGVMDHACAHRTLLKEGSGPRLSIDIAVLVNSPYSHSNDEGFDEIAYAYYEANIINSIGIDKHYQVKESIFNSNTTKINIVNA